MLFFFVFPEELPSELWLFGDPEPWERCSISGIYRHATWIFLDQAFKHSQLISKPSSSGWSSRISTCILVRGRFIRFSVGGANQLVGHLWSLKATSKPLGEACKPGAFRKQFSPQESPRQDMMWFLSRLGVLQLNPGPP